MQIQKLVPLMMIALAAPGISLAQHKTVKCAPGASCLIEATALPEPYSLEAVGQLANDAGLVPVQVRMSHIGGPVGHKWVQFGTGENAITFGYGAADFTLFDAGQVVVTDRRGVDLVSRWHLPGHITPAEFPDQGHTVGPPVYISVEKAQKMIAQQRQHRFVFPYIPMFHDCHTYACSLMAHAEGKSSLPCYLWFKGHF